MTEQNPEQGLDYDKNLREIAEALDAVPLNATLAAFDIRRESLYDSLSELAIKMPEVLALKSQATIDLGGVAESFSEVLYTMVKEGADDAALANTVTGVMANDSAERADLMNRLLGEQHIARFKSEELRDLITQCMQDSESTDQAIDSIESMYHADLSEDVHTFVQVLSHKSEHHYDEEQAGEGQTIEIKKGPKDHAADIAKIALGVTIALSLDRFFHKKD